MKIARVSAGRVATTAVVVVAAALATATYRAVTAPRPAPAVAYTLLDGSVHHTQHLRGKVVLINFWATSCTICVHEMPQIVATHEKFKQRGFETLAVAMSYDAPARVADFAETRRLPFGVAIDNTGEIARRFENVRGTPTTFVINQEGEIVKRYVGEPDFGALHRLIESLLDQA